MINYFLLIALPNIGIILCILSALHIIVGVCIVLSNEGDKKAERTAANKLVIGLFMFILYMLIPTKSDIIQLKIISVVSDLKLNGLAQKTVDKLNKILDG